MPTWAALVCGTALVSLALSGCGDESAEHTVQVTRSVQGTVAVVAGGGTRTVSVAFNAPDGSTPLSLSVDTGSISAAAGWSAPARFVCAVVTTGSGCVLNLTYAPPSVDSGTLVLAYRYRTRTGRLENGSLRIDYVATPANNISATVSPSAQVNAIAGSGSQTVAVTFNTDDGDVATSLTLGTDLASLPPGWTSASHDFECAEVSIGSGCELSLTYAPATNGSGTLVLDYGYVDNSGAPKSGSVAVAYAATSHNNVSAAAAPSGQINAVVGAGNAAVAVTFTTDDGHSATAFESTTDLASLPAGWTSTSGSLSCSEVSTGNGCQLQLSYAPSSVGAGTLTLGYAYLDNSGAAKTGSLDIHYAATSHNNLTGTVTPSGQVNATLGAGSQSVTVAFTTDDANTASNVVLTTDLTSLPGGWSSASPTFACGSASTGNGCELALTYAPVSVASGTLSLQYAYEDNSGAARTGTVAIPYAATSANTVVGTPAPSGQIAVAAGGPGQAVLVTFATDDANPASSLSVTSDLATLPAGWSSASPTFSCASVSSGTACELGLTYAPSAGGSGTLTLNFAYMNNSGTPRTGSVGIPYVATVSHVYVAELNSSLYYCSINGDGTLSDCATTGGISGVTGVVLKDDLAYVTLYGSSTVVVCNIGGDGGLSGCASTGSDFFLPFVAAVSGNTFYAANGHFMHAITYCSIGSNGTLSSCAETSGLSGAEGIASAGGYVYASMPGANTVYVCAQAVDGSLQGCAATGSGFSQPEGIAISGGYAYVANSAPGTVSTCSINTNNGTLSGCTTSTVGSGPMGIALHGSRAYVSTRNGSIFVCDVSGTGALTNCAISNGGAAFGLLVQIAAQ
jgi:hypothetical protein